MNDTKSNKPLLFTSSKIELLDFIICLLLALAFSAAPSYIDNGLFHFSLSYFLMVGTYFIVFLGLNILFKSLAGYCFTDSKITPVGNAFSYIMRQNNNTLILAAIMFLFWIPILLFLWPGTLINDSWGQLNQFIDLVEQTNKSYVLKAHHPIFDTFVMGIIIVPWGKLTGHWHAAIFLYVLLQSLFTCAVFAYSIDYIYKKLHMSKTFSLIMFFMYCCLPIYPISAQTVSKDAFSACFFVIFSVMSMEIVRTKGSYIKHKLLSYILVSVLCCLSKKVNTYVVLFTILIMLISYKNRIQFLISGLVVSSIMFLVLPTAHRCLDIVPGGKQEMFSIPFQQTARYVKYHSDDITEQEYEVIDRLLDMNTLADRYKPIYADSVKGYSERGTTEDYIAYIKVWIKQGLRHPGCYIDAFNAMVSGWFSLSEYAPLMNMNWHSQFKEDRIPSWVPERSGASAYLATEYESFFHALYQIPFFKLFLSYGLYSALIPAFCLSVAFGKKQVRKKYWISYLPMMLSILIGCWLAPVSIQNEGRRYLYPITYTLPLLIGWCAYTIRKEEKAGLRGD